MTKKEKVEIIKQNEKQKKEEKPYFFKRLAAYFIDIFIVSFVISLILLPFPENQNLTKMNKELMKLNQDYVEEKIDVDKYVNQSIGLSRDIAYESVIPTIVNLTAIILYFIVFQFYNKGQTLGKKLLHIRVIKEDGSNLTMNDMIFRSLIINSVLVNMIVLGFTLFSNDTIYFYSSNILQVIQGLILIITVFMVTYRKDGRGLHDLVTRTKVIAE